MQANRTVVLGLTGQTGAGKSTLSRMFSDRGVTVLDADEISRYTLEQSKECRMDLVLEFTTEIIRPDASLNRAKLAEICFSDPARLRRLNQIVYPYIVKEIMHKLKAASQRHDPVVVLDAPTLYESGLDKRCDLVVAVLADEETRLRRILARDEITEEAARLRINAQNKDSFYISRAAEIVRNDAGMDALRFQFVELYGKLERLSRGEPEPPRDPPVVEDARQAFEELADGE